jgi:WD40 repeat protein
VWDLTTGQLRHRYSSPAIGLFSLAKHPREGCAALGTLDGRVALFDLAAGKNTLELLGHKGRVQALAFVPGEHKILSGAADGTLRLWNLRNGAEVRRMTGYWIGCSVDVSRDGHMGLVGLWDGSMWTWDIRTGEWLRYLQGHDEMLFAGARFTPDGRRIVSGSGDLYGVSKDNSIRVWDVETGQELLRCEGHSQHVWDLDVGPEGRYAVSGGHDGTLRVWNLTTGEGRILHDISPQAVRCVAYHPSGHAVLIGFARGTSATPDYSLRLVDVATGQEIRRFSGHSEVIADVAINADGSLALSGANDQHVILWDVKSGNMIRRLRGHTSSITAVAFGARSALAATSDMNGCILVWNIQNGALLRRYNAHDAFVMGLAFGPDDATLLSVANDNTVRQWRLDTSPDDLLDWITANRYIPELSAAQRKQYDIDMT